MYNQNKSIKELTDSTECNINDSYDDFIEELINVQTDKILLNEGACKSKPSDQKVDNGQNQNENMTQTAVININCRNLIYIYAYGICKFIKLQLL